MNSRDSPKEGLENTQVNRRKVGTFLALAFSISWISAIVLHLAGIELGPVTGLVLVTVFFMWAPAIAAITVQLWSGESIRRGCGLRIGRPWRVALAWVAPVALIAATIGVGVVLPGISFTTDYGAYLLDLGLAQEQVDQTTAQLEAFPLPPVILFTIQGLVAGLTINALAALGEELGWRGLLLTELSPLGFWRLSVITGVVWGIWHAPIILQGHNFPDAPLAGVFVMIIAMVAMSPVYTYLTIRAQTVLAATFFHGTFNGLGALSLVYLTGGGDLLLSAVGVAGIGAAVLFTAACIVHDKHVATDSITTGEPLSPWT